MGRLEDLTLIPAFNEELTIGRVVSQAAKFCRVVVIDDCSIDATGEIARKAGAKVIRNEKNLGYARSLEVGLSWASKNNIKNIVVIDADGEHSPAHIKTFLSSLNRSDIEIVFGVRPNFARFSEALFGLFFSFKFDVKDPLCGMKGIKTSVWKSYGPLELTNTIGTQMYVKALMNGSKFEQLEVSGERRIGKPRFGGSFKANLKILLGLWNVLRLYTNGKKYYAK